MNLAYRYILDQFLQTFLPLFTTLFFVVSMFFFIQLARITSSVEISFLELLELYIFLLPKIILLTMPLSFFMSLCLSFYRLSKENELVALFSLGFPPLRFLRFFLRISALSSALLLLIALIFIPISFELFDNFVNYKKFSAKLNLKTSEFGQKYLDWMLFVERQTKEDLYENIIMYHPIKKQGDKEQLVVAKSGKLIREAHAISFKLINGHAYTLEDNKWQIVEFKEFLIRTKFIDYSLNIRSFYNYFDDIFTKKEKAKEFIMYTLIALFPLATTAFAISFGVVTYRYESGYVYSGMFMVIFLYFGSIMLFKANPFIAVASVFATFFISSLLFFSFKTLNKY